MGISFSVASFALALSVIVTMASEFHTCPSPLRTLSLAIEESRRCRNVLSCLLITIIFFASFSSMVSLKCLFLSLELNWTLNLHPSLLYPSLIHTSIVFNFTLVCNEHSLSVTKSPLIVEAVETELQAELMWTIVMADVRFLR